MHARRTAHVDVAKWLVVTATLLLALGGCSVYDGLAVGAPLAAVALRGNPYDSGQLTARLSDGRVLEGTWSKVTQRALPGAVIVETPRGTITAAALVAPESPVVTGTLEGPHVRMICAFVGDKHSGYRSRCTDDVGAEWFGTFWDRGRFTKRLSFYGRVSVTLHERR